MKIFLVIISCFLYCSVANSQNFSTVVQGDTSYFQYYNTYYYDLQNTQLVASVFVDSTSTFAGGNKLYNFKRLDYMNFVSCDSATRINFLGRHIVQDSTGYNVFITEKGDSVFVNTFATPGSSWTYFTFPSGDYLEATLDSISENTIIGVNDSVMNISLQTKNSSGVNVTGEYNGKGILISKNHGLLQTFGYRYFPDDSTTYYLSGWSGNANGAQNLTSAEIFDFDIGDEFHYHNYFSTSFPFHDEIFVEWHVLSKVMSANGDTVTYEMDNTYFHTNINFTTITTTFIHDTVSSNVIYSDLTQINGLSEQLVPNSSFQLPLQFGHTISMQDTTYFSRSRKFSEDFYNYAPPCYVWPIGSGIFPHRIFVKGLGEVLETDNTFNIRYDSLVYYKKGTEEWGQKLNWSVILGVDDLQTNESRIQVHPNPATDFFDVEFDESIYRSGELELFDAIGKSVLKTKLPQNQPIHVDCKLIPNGIYFYTLTGVEGNSASGKIVIAKE